MLTPSQIEQFNANGFLRGNRVLDDQQIEVLRTELERVIANRDNGGCQPILLHNMTRHDDAMIWQIVNIWEASGPFEQLTHNPIIAEEVAQLTGARELRVWHDQIQYKPAGTGGVNNWHQDWPYWPILSGPAQVTAWIALDDVDAENGCMSMVPGSHRWGDQMPFIHAVKNFQSMPARFNEHELKVQLCPVRKGEVHYHHALTWHGSHANTSHRSRRALAVHLMTEETRYKASGAHIMKQCVEVADGAVLAGKHFPLVWSANGQHGD